MRRLSATLLLAALSLAPLTAGSREDLFAAVAENDRPAIEKLVRAGVSINITDPDGRTPLMEALAAGHNDLCRWFLVELGADPDRADSRGDTPLMVTVRHGNRDGLRLLLLRNADTGRVNKAGESALSLAINLGRFAMVEDLLGAGAFLFREKIEWPFLERLYRLRVRVGENRRVLDTAGNGVELFRLVAADDWHGVRELLEQGQSPNTADSVGLTPLMVAATLDRPHMMELLFRYGADPLLRDSLGLTALDYAAYYGKLSAVDYLTTRAFWQKEGVPLERNPLFWAFLGNHADVFSLLVKRGFGNGAPDAEGISLIHYICFFGNLFAFRELAPGADLILLQDGEGKDPLFWALTGFNITGGEGDYYPLVRLLVKSGADGRSRIALVSDRTMGAILTNREQELPK